MNSDSPKRRSSFRELELKACYDSDDDLLGDLYVPLLSRAVTYDRAVGFFSSSALSSAAAGVARFVNQGGTMRLLTGVQLSPEDAAALGGAEEIPNPLAERLAGELVSPDEVKRQRLAVLAWLAANERLEVRVAFPVDEHGEALSTEEGGYYHEKLGLAHDTAGDTICFHGSSNESERALRHNFESLNVMTSWHHPEHIHYWAEAFERRWQGNMRGFSTLPLPDAARHQLLSLVPNEPPLRDPEEPADLAEPTLLGRFLHAAPKLRTAEGLAEQTVPLRSFPHQRQVAERLAGMYPRSWLVADEVGLGKTISAGLALRRLLLSGQVERVLILAPANVARQWQDELFEKFGLWVPRLERQRIEHVHPAEHTRLSASDDPFAVHPVLIASSHLARRPEQRERVLAAGPYDLVVVDEAHHARRRRFDKPERYEPSRLLQLLDRLVDHHVTRSLWMLTATPMQVHPIELFDLVCHLGLPEPLNDWETFQRYYSELATDDQDGGPDWRWLAAQQRAMRLPAWTAAETKVHRNLRTKLGVVDAQAVVRFGEQGNDPEEVAEQLGPRGREELRAWLRLRSPLGQLVTRHTRHTLRRYRREGLLEEPVPERDVDDRRIEMSDPERDLYKRLDGLLDRLMELHGSRRGAGFLLTIYRRRLTSSWAAIGRTLRKRLAREADLADQLDLDLDAELLDELEHDVGEVDPGEIDEERELPLADSDLEEIGGYLREIDRVEDSKLSQLQHDLRWVREQGRAAIVFTQFTDTLDHLAEQLRLPYGGDLATYTGKGGRIWDASACLWQPVSKQQLADAVQRGERTVVVANDAASEGLNLQRASVLINYDLPWNPMRVEQRIGRIDRIGQQAPQVVVRNYVLPDTVEDDVMSALRERIESFDDLVGGAQPIIGEVEQAMKRSYEMTGPEARRQAAAEAVERVVDKVQSLREQGVELGEEDALPPPEYPTPPVTLSELHGSLDELGLDPARANRPVSYGRGASRDREDWRALVTYGHPVLDGELGAVASAYHERNGPVVFAEEEGVVVAMRTDRTPPQEVARVTDLLDLGSPVARGEAHSQAKRVARDAARERRARYDAAPMPSSGSGRSDLQTRFVTWAEKMLTLLAGERDQSPSQADTTQLWEGLTQEPQPFASAPPLSQHLHLSPKDMDISSDDLRRLRSVGSADRMARRQQLEQELIELIREWKQVH